jgi:hypothetical protein
MTPFSIIKDFDVIKQAADSLRPAEVPVVIYPFSLQQVKETLSDSIIVTVSLATHAADHAIAGKQTLVILEAYWLPRSE